MENEATTKTPISTRSGFHNLAFCTLILAFPTRPSCPACPRSTNVERALQIAPFLQNKPNFKIGKMTISTVATKSYPKEQRTMSTERHSKQTQSNPISPPSLPNFVDKSRSLWHHINNCVYWTLEVVLEVRFGAENAVKAVSY
jgi:hypothetical protein